MTLVGPVLVLGAPSAGSRSRSVADRLAHDLRALGADVVRISGSSASAAVAHARGLAVGGVPGSHESPRALVAVGGDGTVQLAATALAGTGVPLYVVPAGSGNDAARALGVVARTPQDAAEHLYGLLRDGAIARSIDVLEVAAGEGAPVRDVVSVIAAGFDAAVNARANLWADGPPPDRRRTLGHRLPPRARYTGAVLALLPSWRPRRYRLGLDGVEHEVEASLIAIANTASYGGGMRIAPRADPRDGLADVVVVSGLGRLGLLALLPTAFLGWHTAAPAVTVHRARHVTLALVDGGGGGAGTDPTIVAHGDGEALHAPPLDVRVRRDALRLLT